MLTFWEAHQRLGLVSSFSNSTILLYELFCTIELHKQDIAKLCNSTGIVQLWQKSSGDSLNVPSTNQVFENFKNSFIASAPKISISSLSSFPLFCRGKGQIRQRLQVVMQLALVFEKIYFVVFEKLLATSLQFWALQVEPLRSRKFQILHWQQQEFVMNNYCFLNLIHHLFYSTFSGVAVVIMGTSVSITV